MKKSRPSTIGEIEISWPTRRRQTSKMTIVSH
jgi:hypothetical protein